MKTPMQELIEKISLKVVGEDLYLLPTINVKELEEIVIKEMQMIIELEERLKQLEL